MVSRRRLHPLLITLASMVMTALVAIPATTANASSVPSRTATTPSASTATARPAAPRVAQALGQSATLRSSASAAVTVTGPFLIQPFTDIYDAADAFHQNDATYAWLYTENDSAAQKWYIASAYNIDGYIGSAIYANYGGHLMCMNVKGNVYQKGTQIWVSECENSLQLNELWEIFGYPVEGKTMYTICASFETGLCINVSGGIQTGNLLIIWDLDQLWDNSLWQFYNA